MNADPCGSGSTALVQVKCNRRNNFCYEKFILRSNFETLTFGCIPITLTPTKMSRKKRIKIKNKECVSCLSILVISSRDLFYLRQPGLLLLLVLRLLLPLFLQPLLLQGLFFDLLLLGPRTDEKYEREKYRCAHDWPTF